MSMKQTDADYQQHKSEEMTDALALYEQDACLQVVKLEAGKPVEYWQEGDQDSQRRLDIILGEVCDVSPSLQAVFVEIGTDQPGFLPLNEAPALISTGQPLMVQIKRLCEPPKGHQLTTQFQLPGPYAVLRPGRTPLRRSRLKTMPADKQAVYFDRDLQRLTAAWAAMTDQAESGSRPRRLASPGNLLDTALISLFTPATRVIHCEGAALYERVYQRLKQLLPSDLNRLKLHPEQEAGTGYRLPVVLGLSHLQEEMTKTKVYLKHGGFLFIEKTQALTVIDVNSGKDNRGRDKQNLINRVNLEAAEEAVRQLRLRNLGGMILIDFITVRKDEDREALEQHLRVQLAKDRAHVRLHGFTRLGLYELTRTAL